MAETWHLYYFYDGKIPSNSNAYNPSQPSFKEIHLLLLILVLYRFCATPSDCGVTLV